MTEIVKKKRGRKPKPKIVTTEPQTEEKKKGKKRGRKPKIKVDNPEEQLLKLLKKRGRKPKEVVVTVQPNTIKEEPIILHLPLKHIGNPNEIYIPKPFIDIDKFNSKFKNINNDETINNIETTIDEIAEPNVINKFNKLCSEYSNVIERDKVFPIFLEFNEHNKKKNGPILLI